MEQHSDPATLKEVPTDAPIGFKACITASNLNA